MDEERWDLSEICICCMFILNIFLFFSVMVSGVPRTRISPDGPEPFSLHASDELI